MFGSVLLLVAGFASDPSLLRTSTATHQRQAERFVDAAIPEGMPSMDPGTDPIAEELLKANPGREADVRRIAEHMHMCIIGSDDGKAAMRQAAIEAALAFNGEQLERLIAFVERDAQRGKGAAKPMPERDAARRDYGRFMYGIASQPSAVALARRCSDERAALMAAAGLRERPSALRQRQTCRECPLLGESGHPHCDAGKASSR